MNIEGTLTEHYKAVRHRLMNSAPRMLPPPAEPVTLDKPFWLKQQEKREAEREERERIIHTYKMITPSRKIIYEVAERHGLKFSDIVGKSRTRKVVNARFEAMAIVHQTFPGKSLIELGKVFGRDHTSCLSALRKMGVYKNPSIFRQNNGG